jgi:hypothetical protein
MDTTTAGTRLRVPNYLNIDAVSFISKTLQKECHSRTDTLVAWDHVTLYDHGRNGHVVIDDENLDNALMYQIVGFCRYQGISHNVTSGTLNAVPQTGYLGMDVVVP